MAKLEFMTMVWRYDGNDDDGIEMMKIMMTMMMMMAGSPDEG